MTIMACPSHIALRRALLLAALLFVAGAPATACAPARYSDEVRHAKTFSLQGDTLEAIEALNAELGVPKSEELPVELNHNSAMLLLERATLLQAEGQYALSARDMIVVDDQLEWLDIDAETAPQRLKLAASEQLAHYQAPAHERLMLNLLNLINYMALSKLEEARVEARRFTILERYFLDEQGAAAILPELLALGNYLSAAAFEGSGHYAQAAERYAKAWHAGLRDETLRERLRDLYRLTHTTTSPIQDPFFEQTLKEARALGALSLADYAETHQLGDTLVIMQYGFSPYKRAERFPIAEARRRAGMEPSSTSSGVRAVRVAEPSVQGLPERDLSSSRVRIDDENLALVHGIDLGESVLREWALVEPQRFALAIARAESRATIGSSGRAASHKQGENLVVGALLWVTATGAETALHSADQPDTRSWTTLPGYIRIARTKLPRGSHTFEAVVEGSGGERRTLEITEARTHLLNFSKHR